MSDSNIAKAAEIIRTKKKKFVPGCTVGLPFGYSFFKITSIKITLKIVFMNSTGKVVLAIIGAAAAGAVIGMLVAPEKGSDLRRKITDATGDLSSQLSQLIDKGRAQLENLKQTATEQGRNLTGEAEERLNKVKERVS